MAAQGKNTGLQVGLIVAVVVALIASVAAFLLYRTDQQNEARYAAGQREKDSVQTAAESARQDLSLVKQALGVQAADVGTPADAAAGTVLGTVNSKLTTLTDGAGADSLLSAAETLKAQLDAARTKEGEQARQIAQLEREINALEARYNERATQFSDAAGRANEDLAGVQARVDERVNSEVKVRRDAEDALAALRAEFEELKAQKDNVIRGLEDENEDLVRTNQRIRDRLEATESKTFDSPDGRVVNVEPTTETIYVDLGQGDQLRPGVTFSVYDKDKVGPTGGDRAALKGSIEIISVGRTNSEARILESDFRNPISPGDPIYSPIWSQGRAGQYAFVGLIDLDGDGNTDGERDRLRRVLADAGAEFSVYIDDEGNWVDGDGDPETDRPLDPRTEMLVIADVPDQTTVTDPEDKAAAERMRKQFEILQNQARRNGIPVRTLKVFLDSIGYQERRRRYAPGDDASFNRVRGGNRSAVQPNPGSTTSGLFDRNAQDRARGQQTLPSNRFRNGGN